MPPSHGCCMLPDPPRLTPGIANQYIVLLGTLHLIALPGGTFHAFARPRTSSGRLAVARTCRSAGGPVGIRAGLRCFRSTFLCSPNLAWWRLSEIIRAAHGATYI